MRFLVPGSLSPLLLKGLGESRGDKVFLGEIRSPESKVDKEPDSRAPYLPYLCGSSKFVVYEVLLDVHRKLENRTMAEVEILHHEGYLP